MRTTVEQVKQAEKDISKRLRTLPENFLDCRDPGIRHAWMKDLDFHVIEARAERGGAKAIMLGRVEICDRCGCVKEEKFIVGRSGIEKIGQKYIYPDQYLIPGVTRGVKKSSVVWQENYRRAMERVASVSSKS